MATIRINYDTYLVGARKPRERRCIDFYATSRTAMMIILILLAYLVEAATAQRVLSADIWKPQFAANSTFLDSNETLSKRQLTSILTEKPDRSLYWINITIGSPGQAQALQLDTGSRGLIVPSTSSSICSSTLIPCSVLGSFDSSKSTTFDDTDQSTTEGFGDGGSVTGDWFYDTVHIGSQAVTSQLAVLATSGSVIAEGVLGVGFPASYPTINHNLAAQGVIASNSYSIWLNELSAASGTILFGGLDLAKFVAPLLKMPVVGGTTNADGSVSYDQPTVELSRVATLQGTTSTVQTATVYSENAVLDTGTELTILQKPLADSIIAAMGAQYYPSTATSGAQQDLIAIDFHFSDPVTGPTINVAISELVLQALGAVNGIEMCLFGIYSAAPSDGLPTIMGDTFLRSAYVVYDLDTNHIGMAQAVFDEGTADVLEIPEGGIPVGTQT